MTSIREQIAARGWEVRVTRRTTRSRYSARVIQGSSPLSPTVEGWGKTEDEAIAAAYALAVQAAGEEAGMPDKPMTDRDIEDDAYRRGYQAALAAKAESVTTQVEALRGEIAALVTIERRIEVVMWGDGPRIPRDEWEAAQEAVEARLRRIVGEDDAPTDPPVTP